MSQPKPEFTRTHPRRASDIFSHLLPHSTRMDPTLLRKEIAKVVFNFLTRNRVDPNFYRVCVSKAKDVCASSDQQLPSSLANFALWLERLVPEPNGYTLPITNITLDDGDTLIKKPHHLLDAFRYDLGISYFDGEPTKSGFRFYVGSEHQTIPYIICRKLAVEHEQTSSVYADDGRISGKINWMNLATDQIAIAMNRVSNAATVVEGIVNVFPHYAVQLAGIGSVVSELSAAPDPDPEHPATEHPNAIPDPSPAEPPKEY